MENFLYSYYITKYNQNHVNNLNIPVTCKEIEVVIKRLPNKQTKRQGSDGFSAECFKKEVIPTLLKVFHIIEIKGTWLNTFVRLQLPCILFENLNTDFFQYILIIECYY